jgi:hypothetical protein
MFARQSRPFQHVSSSQLASLPVTDDILPVLVLGFSRGSSLPPGRVHHTLPSTAGLAQSFSNKTSLSVDATGQKSSSAHLGMHAQPSTDYPMSWQWTPTQLHARLTPTAMAQNVHPSDKSQRVPKSHSSSVAGSSNAMAVPLTYDDPLIRVPPPTTSEPSYPAAPSTLSRLPETTAPVGRTIGNFAREKKHGCWMCHKSFDRPSTLRKVSYHQTRTCLGWD